jgi:transcriptional regulator with XRE-family HTH domain
MPTTTRPRRLALPFSGARLREARERAGMTRASLARAAGFSERHIHRLEADHAAPRPPTLLALAEAIGVELDVLLAPTATVPATAPAA